MRIKIKSYVLVLALFWGFAVTGHTDATDAEELDLSGVLDLLKLKDVSKEESDQYKRNLTEIRDENRSTLLKQHEDLIYDDKTRGRALNNAPLGLLPIESDSVLRGTNLYICLLYTSPSPRDATLSRMPSSA